MEIIWKPTYIFGYCCPSAKSPQQEAVEKLSKESMRFIAFHGKVGSNNPNFARFTP